MANTYTQIHIQIVFAVKNRQSLIHRSWMIRLQKYIAGIIQNNGHKVIIINGMPDHLHILVGMRPVQALSELVKNIKQDSSKWINKNGLCVGKFSWQSGYGAFSYSKSQLPRVIKYIQNQEEHHRKTRFALEYRELLEDFEVTFDDRYLLKGVIICSVPKGMERRVALIALPR